MLRWKENWLKRMSENETKYLGLHFLLGIILKKCRQLRQSKNG